MKISETSSYLNSKAVIAGTIIALAVSLILIPFGNSIGLTVSTPLKPENAKWVVLTIGLWLLWVQLLSSIIGGYFAGRTVEAPINASRHETEFRDGVHGLLAWGLSTVLAFAGAAVAAALANYAGQHATNLTAHVAVADITRRATIIFSFGTAASSIVSAAAAWWMAVLAGEHRDNDVDFSHHISYRKKKRSK